MIRYFIILTSALFLLSCEKRNPLIDLEKVFVPGKTLNEMSKSLTSLGYSFEELTKVEAASYEVSLKGDRYFLIDEYVTKSKYAYIVFTTIDGKLSEWKRDESYTF